MDRDLAAIELTRGERAIVDLQEPTVVGIVDVEQATVPALEPARPCQADGRVADRDVGDLLVAREIEPALRRMSAEDRDVERTRRRPARRTPAGIRRVRGGAAVE